jgi:hypothetical protein
VAVAAVLAHPQVMLAQMAAQELEMAELEQHRQLVAHQPFTDLAAAALVT